MTKVLDATMSVTLNALRWSSLVIRGDPSCVDVGFLLDASDTRRFSVQMEESAPHPQSHIDDLRTARATCLVPAGSMCGQDEEAVAFGELRDRQHLCSLSA